MAKNNSVVQKINPFAPSKQETASQEMADQPISTVIGVDDGRKEAAVAERADSAIEDASDLVSGDSQPSQQAADAEQPEARAIPSWSEFAAHVREHGDTIIQARYPNPPHALIDTIWRGVPVFDSETVGYRYLVLGWLDHGQV